MIHAPQKLLDLSLQLLAAFGRHRRRSWPRWLGPPDDRRLGGAAIPRHATKHGEDLREDPEADEENRQKIFQPIEPGGEEDAGDGHGKA